MNQSFFPFSLRAGLLIPILTFSLNAFSWGLTGHRVVAEIAQNHLSRKAKKELSKLFGNESLAWWSNWPDFIRSDSTWNEASPWHWVNIAGNLDKETFISTLKAIPGKNLYTQISAMIAELKDKSLPLEQRQIALRFLIHFIGDLHQPLHVGRAEDMGGNKITVYWFERKTNLHSLWDSGLIEFQQYSYTEYAKLVDIASREQVKTWQQSSLDEWFYESYVLANRIYSLSASEVKLGYQYNYLFQKDLDTQLLKGGVRLAQILNEALS